MSYGPAQSLEEGFNKFVIKKDGCWDWWGCAPKIPGYGQFRSMGKLYRSHHASWIIHNGPIPEGKWVLHKCDNYKCSNPDHLFLGDNITNIQDMIQKKRSPILYKKGEENPSAKLSNEVVMAIKKDIKEKCRSIDVAHKFNITPQRVYDIKNSRSWGAL